MKKSVLDLAFFVLIPGVGPIISLTKLIDNLIDKLIMANFENIVEKPSNENLCIRDKVCS